MTSSFINVGNFFFAKAMRVFDDVKDLLGLSNADPWLLAIRIWGYQLSLEELAYVVNTWESALKNKT